MTAVEAFEPHSHRSPVLRSPQIAYQVPPVMPVLMGEDQTPSPFEWSTRLPSPTIKTLVRDRAKPARKLPVMPLTVVHVNGPERSAGIVTRSGGGRPERSLPTMPAMSSPPPVAMSSPMPPTLMSIGPWPWR